LPLWFFSIILRSDIGKPYKENKRWLIDAIKKTDNALKQVKPTLFDKMIYYLLFWPFRTHPSVEERLKNITSTED